MARGPRSSTRAGHARCSSTASAAMGRRWPPPRRRATTHRSCSSPCGRRSSCWRPRPGATSRSWRALLTSASSRRRPSRPPTGRSASRRARVRCSARARPPSACTARRSSGCGRTRLRPELARAHLLYGEWLRRERIAASTRAPSCAPPTSQLASMGMEAFAERAERELLATGEKVRKRTVETRDELTAAGAADRAARPRRALEPRDRRAALPQPAHRGVAPAQGVRQARDPLAPRAGRRAAQLRLRADPGLSSGRPGVDSTTRRPSDRSRSLSVLSPSSWSRAHCSCCAGRPEHLEEVGQGGRELAVGGQRHPVDVGLRARDRVVIEAREPRRDRLDLVVEPVVGDRPVDVPVLLRARSVEVVGDEQDLERAAATDQPREPAPSGRRRGPRPVPTSNWPSSVFSREANRRSQASTNSLPAPRARPRIEAMLTAGARDRRTRRSSHACIPVGPTPQRRGPGRVVLDVVVGEIEVGVGAVEDDDVEVGVLLDQADELGELGDGRRGDRVDRRVVERHPAVARAATVDA